MSRVLPRLAALLAAAPLTAAALVAAAPAAGAAVLPTCGSTPFYDFSVAGTGANRLAIDTSSTAVTICFGVFGDTDALVVRPTVGFTPPTITQTTGTLPCDQPIFDSTQPISLHVSVGADATAQLVCLSLNGQTTVVTFALPSLGALPSVELWRPGNDDLLDYAACAGLLAEWEAGLIQRTTWEACLYSGPKRIV